MMGEVSPPPRHQVRLVVSMRLVSIDTSRSKRGCSVHSMFALHTRTTVATTTLQHR